MKVEVKEEAAKTELAHTSCTRTFPRAYKADTRIHTPHARGRQREDDDNSGNGHALLQTAPLSRARDYHPGCCGSTTYNRAVNRVHHVANHTRTRRRYHGAPLRHVVPVTVMLLMIALPILAGDDVRRAGPRARLPGRRQLAVRVLHGDILQDQTLNFFPLGRPIRDGRILILRDRVVRGLGNVTLHHVGEDLCVVAADDRRLVPVDHDLRLVGEGQRIDPDRPGQPEGGRLSLQLLALAVPVRSHLPAARFRMAGLVSAVAAISLRVQQSVAIGATVGGCLLTSGFSTYRGAYVGIGLLAQQHAGGTLDDGARHRRLQRLVVAHEGTVVPVVVTVLTLLLLPQVIASTPPRVVGVPPAGVLVQDCAVLVLQAVPRVTKSSTNIGRSSDGRASPAAIVEGGCPAHPRGQLLEQTRAGVAQHLRDARRGGRARVAVTRSRGRALSRGRHGVARREYEHLGRFEGLSRRNFCKAISSRSWISNIEW